MALLDSARACPCNPQHHHPSTVGQCSPVRPRESHSYKTWHPVFFFLHFSSCLARSLSSAQLSFFCLFCLSPTPFYSSLFPSFPPLFSPRRLRLRHHSTTASCRCFESRPSASVVLVLDAAAKVTSYVVIGVIAAPPITDRPSSCCPSSSPSSHRGRPPSFGSTSPPSWSLASASGSPWVPRPRPLRVSRSPPCDRSVLPIVLVQHC